MCNEETKLTKIASVDAAISTHRQIYTKEQSDPL